MGFYPSLFVCGWMAGYAKRVKGVPRLMYKQQHRGDGGFSDAHSCGRRERKDSSIFAFCGHIDSCVAQVQRLIALDRAGFYALLAQNNMDVSMKENLVSRSDALALSTVVQLDDQSLDMLMILQEMQQAWSQMLSELMGYVDTSPLSIKTDWHCFTRELTKREQQLKRYVFEQKEISEFAFIDFSQRSALSNDLNVIRCEIRHAERMLVALMQVEAGGRGAKVDIDVAMLSYLNRSSSLVFWLSLVF